MNFYLRCLRGTMMFLGTVVFYFITLFCRMVFLTVENGYWIQSKVSLSTMFTTCLQHLIKILCGVTRLMFGSSMSHLRCLYLCGISSATVFQQRMITLRDDHSSWLQGLGVSRSPLHYLHSFWSVMVPHSRLARHLLG